MSAYIVDDATIHAIVTWARSLRASCQRLDGEPGWIAINELDPSAIGQNLLNENYKSVNHRYSEKDVPSRYTFREVHSIKRGDFQHHLTAIDIIKVCNCLSYQSCEHPGWETSWAKTFLDQVVDNSISRLPGYDAAPWGIRDDQIGTVVSLASLAAAAKKPAKKRRA